MTGSHFRGVAPLFSYANEKLRSRRFGSRRLPLQKATGSVSCQAHLELVWSVTVMQNVRFALGSSSC